MSAALLRGAIAFAIGDLDPRTATGAGGSAVLDHIHEPLADRSAHQHGRGLLASPPERAEAGTIVLRVAPDARFHSGRPVRAEDVARSIADRLGPDAAAGPMATLFAPIRSASAVAFDTVVLQTALPPSVVAARLRTVRVTPADGGTDGTGAYALAEADREHALLEPVRADRPRVSLHFVPAAADRLSLVLSGDVDACEEPALLPADVRRLDDAGVRWAAPMGTNTAWIMACGPGVGPRGETAGDRRRVAALAQSAQIPAPDGLYEPGSSWAPGFDAAVTALGAHPGEAPSPGRSGRPLNIAVSSADWIRRDVAPPVLAALADAGIAHTATTVHTSEVFAHDIPSGRYDHLIASGDPGAFAGGPCGVLAWYLSGYWAREYLRWSTPGARRVAELLERWDATGDPARDGERAASAQVLDIVREEAPICPLGRRRQPTCWSARLHGFAPSASTGVNLTDAVIK